MSTDKHEIVSINLRKRWAITNRDELCEITNLFDEEGDETDDLEQAYSAVAKLDDNNWFTIDISEFNPPERAS